MESKKQLCKQSQYKYFLFFYFFIILLLLMFFLTPIFKFLQMLHSESATGQLAGGFVLGMYLGFTPASNLLWVSYFILLLILRVNIGAAMLSFALMGALSFALDPLFHQIGLMVLVDQKPLRPFWISLSNTPVVPFTSFNNTVVMGSFVVSLLLTIPLYFLFSYLIKVYRLKVVSKVKTTWLFRAWTASSFYPLYEKYRQITG